MGRGGGKGGMSLNAWGKPGKKGGGGTGGGGGVITAVDNFLLGLLEKVFPHQEDTKWAEDEYQFYLEQKFGQSGAEQTLADESARTGVELACKAAERYGPRQNPYPKTGLTLAEWEATEAERKRQNCLQAERNALVRKERNRATKAARRKAETQSLKSEALAQQVQERKLVHTMLGRGSYDRASTAKQRQSLVVQARKLKALRRQNQQNLKQGYVARNVEEIEIQIAADLARNEAAIAKTRSSVEYQNWEAQQVDRAQKLANFDTSTVIIAAKPVVLKVEPARPLSTIAPKAVGSRHGIRFKENLDSPTLIAKYGVVSPPARPPAKSVKAVAPPTQRRAQSGQRQEALTSVKFPKGTRIIGFDSEYLAAATYFKTAGDAYRYYQNVTTEPNVIRLAGQTGEEASKPAYTAFHDYAIFEVAADTPAKGRAQPGFYVAYGVMASARTAYRAGIDDFPLQNPTTGKVRNKASNNIG